MPITGRPKKSLKQTTKKASEARNAVPVGMPLKVQMMKK
jgi:hypothetical protein